jgi:hypothetical protein
MYGNRRILAVLFFLISSSIACASLEKLGDLKVDTAPQTFTLKGETIHIFHANVISGTRYRVLIHPMDNQKGKILGNIEICPFGTDICGDKAIAQANSQSTLEFTAPSAAEVYILISVDSVENGRAVGTCTIKLEKVTP